MKKKSKHIGQLPLDAVEQSLDDAILKSDRPKGMPALSAIKTEVKKYGLLDSDAEHMHDIWMMNGFTLKGGKKVQDWKAAIRVWHRNEYFPSQRKAAKNSASAAYGFAGHKLVAQDDSEEAYAMRRREIAKAIAKLRGG